jgi:Phytanoyl-CoA dioxygenase (PhyH)
VATDFIPVLSDQHIRNFCSAGYCVSRVSIPDEIATRAVEKVWELCPPSFQANKPQTWQGEFRDCCKTQSIKDRGGRVKFRECLRGERWLYDLTAGNRDVLGMVAELIGEPVEPEYVRGLYPVFPTRPRPAHGHCDRHKFQVGVVLYLSDVLPQGGGFTVWPGSHYSMAKHQGTLGGDDRFETFETALTEVEASTRPVEIKGPTGTLVLWHQRLVHTAGRNTQRAVRHATLCDFKNQAFLAAAYCKADDLWQTWSSRTKHVAASTPSSMNRLMAMEI